MPTPDDTLRYAAHDAAVLAQAARNRAEDAMAAHEPDAQVLARDAALVAAMAARMAAKTAYEAAMAAYEAAMAAEADAHEALAKAARNASRAISITADMAEGEAPSRRVWAVGDPAEK